MVQLPDGRFRMYVAAKATDDAAANNLRSVIVSATTPHTVPALGLLGAVSVMVGLTLSALLAARWHSQMGSDQSPTIDSDSLHRCFRASSGCP